MELRPKHLRCSWIQEVEILGSRRRESGSGPPHMCDQGKQADEACRQCGSSCGNHQALGADVSSSFRQSLPARCSFCKANAAYVESSNQQFSTSYGSGSVSGSLCSDDMSIAGMDIKAHQFGVTTQVSGVPCIFCRLGTQGGPKSSLQGVQDPHLSYADPCPLLRNPPNSAPALSPLMASWVSPLTTCPIKASSLLSKP